MNNTTSPSTSSVSAATAPAAVMTKQGGRGFQRATLFVIWAWLIIFALIPNILVIAASFLTRDEDKFLTLPVTLENYIRLIDPLYLKVFLHSLSMAGMTTIICLLLGYPFAYLVSKADKKWRFGKQCIPDQIGDHCTDCCPKRTKQHPHNHFRDEFKRQFLKLRFDR